MATAAATALGVQGAASAAPLILVTFEGTTNANLTGYSSTVQAAPGQTVYYEAIVSLTKDGVSNSNDAANGLTKTQVVGTNGVNSLQLAISDSQSDSLNFSPDSSWTNGTGHGIQANGFLFIQSPNVEVGANAANASQFLTGSIVAGDWPSDTLTAVMDVTDTAYGTTIASANILYSKSKVIFASSSTETSNDPYVSFTPLTINTTPEPASIGLLALGGLGLLIRRRRNA